MKSNFEMKLASPTFDPNNLGRGRPPTKAKAEALALLNQVGEQRFFEALYERPWPRIQREIGAAQIQVVKNYLNDSDVPPPATAKPAQQARQEKPANTQARTRGQMPTVEEARYSAHMLRAFLVANGYEDISTSIEVALRSTPVNITSR